MNENNCDEPAKTINAVELSTWSMGDGRGKAMDVIVDGNVKHYVGIGWIHLREATEEDYHQFPIVFWDTNK